MIVTEQIQLKKTKELSKLCHLTKNLWNTGNWLIRMRYFFRLQPDQFNEKWFKKQKIKILNKYHKEFQSEYFNNLEQLEKNYILKLNIPKGKQGYYENIEFLYYRNTYNLLKFEQVYKDLPAQTSQQILRLLDKAWKGYFQANKKYRKNFKKLKGKQEFLPIPKIPGYKKKNGESIAIFTNQQCKIRDGYLIFLKSVNIEKVKTRIKEFQYVRILPRGLKYIVEIVYEKEIKDLRLNKENIVCIDLGLNNLITAVNNNGYTPFIIKGGVVKSINQFYNKKLVYFKSIAKKINNKELTKRILKLHLKRNNKIKDIFHKISKKIIRYCIKNNIGIIIIGYNEGWKQNINIGKRNNQNFVSVPFNTLINQIEYKAKLVGIKIKISNESYTSKCSFLDDEEICKHTQYAGKRISRGLFRSSNGTIINADINAAYNIMRKAVSNFEMNDGIEALGLKPQIIKFI